MRYDMDEILNKAYKQNNCTVEIKPSHALNQETISKMREQSRMDKRKLGFRLNKVAKLAVACCGVAIIAGVTTVAYSAIKEHYNSTITKENGTVVELSSDVHYKELPEHTLKDETFDENEVQWNQIVDMLGFPLLGNGDVDTGAVIYDEMFNSDGSVAVIDLYIPNFKIYGETDFIEDGNKFYMKRITLFIELLDADAEMGYVLPFVEGKDAMGGKELIAKYHSETLDTEVIIYNNVECMNGNFVYDNVYYRLSGWNVTEQEMREAIEGLK